MACCLLALLSTAEVVQYRRMARLRPSLVHIPACAGRSRLISRRSGECVTSQKHGLSMPALWKMSLPPTLQMSGISILPDNPRMAEQDPCSPPGWGPAIVQHQLREHHPSDRYRQYSHFAMVLARSAFVDEHMCQCTAPATKAQVQGPPGVNVLHMLPDISVGESLRGTLRRCIQQARETW